MFKYRLCCSNGRTGTTDFPLDVHWFGLLAAFIPLAFVPLDVSRESK